MQSGEELQLNWVILLEKLRQRNPGVDDLDDVLLLIGIRESCMSPRHFTDNEKSNLIHMAACTVLVPARYYELFWVEDSGWPHYKQLQREPAMTPQQREEFLKPWILQYIEKNKFV